MIVVSSTNEEIGILTVELQSQPQVDRERSTCAEVLPEGTAISSWLEQFVNIWSQRGRRNTPFPCGALFPSIN